MFGFKLFSSSLDVAPVATPNGDIFHVLSKLSFARGHPLGGREFADVLSIERLEGLAENELRTMTSNVRDMTRTLLGSHT